MSWAESEAFRKAHPDLKQEAKGKSTNNAPDEADQYYDCEKCGVKRYKAFSMDLHDAINHRGTTFRSKPYRSPNNNQQQKSEEAPKREEKRRDKKPGDEERFYSCLECDGVVFSNRRTWTMDDHDAKIHGGKSYRSGPMTKKEFLAYINSGRHRQGRSRAHSQPKPQPKPKQTPQPARPTAPKGQQQKRPADFYELLGITPKATPAEIMQAAKEKRIECHPDKLKKMGMSAQELEWIDARAKAVGEAADTLVDPEMRARYDRKRKV
ncbi:MAG: hypothetical protein Q9220_004814 [cf. Caloplaca sp. 1 TL-2023]